MERAGVGGALVDTALLTDGSFDSGLAAATRFGVGGGGAVSADGSGESWSPRSHFDTALLADGSDDSRSAASTCVSVAGGASTC